MRHVAWCQWHGMITLHCQSNDIPTDLQLKTGCLARKPSFSLSTAQKSFIYTPQRHGLEVVKCFRNGTQCLNFGLQVAHRLFTLANDHVSHVWQSITQSRSQKRVFVTREVRLVRRDTRLTIRVTVLGRGLGVAKS